MACEPIASRVLTACMLVASASAFAGGVFAPGPLTIGMTAVELQESLRSPKGADTVSAVVASTARDLMPTYIHRGIERGLDRRVIVHSLFTVAGWKGDPPLGATVEPIVTNAGELGVKLSAKIGVRVGTQTLEDEEAVLLSPKTNFGELDEKLNELSLKIARRIAFLSTMEGAEKRGLPRGIVRFYCVEPASTDSRDLVLLARRLTLELPFYLSQASRKRGLDMIVRGLDVKEAVMGCEKQPEAREVPGSRERKIESYAWEGTVTKSGIMFPTYELSLRSSDPNLGGNYSRVGRVVVGESLAEAADQVIDQFISQFRSAEK